MAHDCIVASGCILNKCLLIKKKKLLLLQLQLHHNRLTGQGRGRATSEEDSEFA